MDLLGECTVCLLCTVRYRFGSRITGMKNGTDQLSSLTKSAQYIRIRYVYKVEFTLFQTFYLLLFLRRVINTLPKIKEESQ